MPGGFHTLLHFTLTTLSNEHCDSHFIKRETEELRDRADQQRTVKRERIGPAPRLGPAGSTFELYALLSLPLLLLSSPHTGTGVRDALCGRFNDTKLVKNLRV